MRGIGILSMLVGHCVIPDLLHKFIYMWHMPLFFIVSGYFFKRKNYMDTIYGSFKNLIFPYLTVCIIVILLMADRQAMTRYIFSAAGLSILCEDKGAFLYSCPGPLWFIPALFWSRIIYSIVDCRLERHKQLSGGVILVISFLCVYVGSKHYIPFYIGHGGAGLIFYHIGRLARNVNIGQYIKSYMVWMTAIASVGAGMCVGEVYFFNLGFSFWLLNVVSASGATFILYALSNEISCLRFANCLAFFGKISILLLCVHAIDSALMVSKNILDLISLEGTAYYLSYNILLMSIAVCGAIALTHIKIVRRVFNIKK